MNIKNTIMENNENNRQPASDKNDNQVDNSGKYERKNDPVAGEGSGSDRAQSDRQAEREHAIQQTGEWPRPLTNQDEQRKTTNAETGPEGQNEDNQQESDSNLKQIDPYKNIGDDSKEVEKKSPVNENQDAQPL
jgi:hypothetical protein